MSDIAIKIDSLSKRYRIGARQGQYKYRTIRDALANAVRIPFDRARAALAGKACSAQNIDNTIWALKDISFHVNRGEVIGIIGRNGAGKTTLLKILSRITEPTKGRVEIHGRVGSLLEVGTGFHPELTGRENIFLNGAVLGMRKREIFKKFDEIVAFAETEKFIDTPVKFYSSGMYLRLAFAVAAHLEPEILLVDEVLTVGDLAFQKKCIGKMGEVAKVGRTVFFVSHNMASIRRLCSRAILLEDGNKVVDGAVNDTISKYLQSGITQRGEWIWKDTARAPGNDIVRLRAIRSLNQNGEVASQFDVTEPFSMEIEFEVFKSGHCLDAGLHFTNEDGNRIFIANDFQSVDWQNKVRPVGIHHSICHMPANLLNEGAINIQVSICSNPYVRHAYEADALHIKIIDDFKPSGARGNYSRQWPSVVVRPLFHWSFKFDG